jgi:hypothetical protein
MPCPHSDPGVGPAAHQPPASATQTLNADATRHEKREDGEDSHPRQDNVRPHDSSKYWCESSVRRAQTGATTATTATTPCTPPHTRRSASDDSASRRATALERVWTTSRRLIQHNIRLTPRVVLQLQRLQCAEAVRGRLHLELLRALLLHATTQSRAAGTFAKRCAGIPRAQAALSRTRFILPGLRPWNTYDC